MGKRPASMFYWMDFDRDTRALSLRAVGAWMRIMGQLHFSNDRGRKRQSVRSWANVTGCTPSELEKIISELREHNVGKFRFYHGQLTIISRRMIREEEQRENENERVRRFRLRGKQ
ncbi:MAG: hypothetical protein IIB39_06665 [Candidatus Marinimicrobia bacterium]|nr:hypothetical protein [Candidatus Neomarinimicrobiota bacterium]